MSRADTLRQRWNNMPAPAKQAWRDKIGAAMQRYKHRLTITDAPPPAPLAVDLTRRHFIFGAAAAGAALIVPARTYHFIVPPKPALIQPLRFIVPHASMFDLPNVQTMELMQKIIDGQYKVSMIPRWVVLDQKWYDDMVQRESQNLTA